VAISRVATIYSGTESFEGTLVQSDIFSTNFWEKNAGVLEKGKFGVVHAGLFLHLFSWEKQLEVRERVVESLKKEKGSWFVGEMVGCKEGGEREVGKGNVWLHDEGSFQRLGRRLWRRWGRMEGSCKAGSREIGFVFHRGGD